MDQDTSEKYCQNAQMTGLCDGLDLVFGSGYKKECCQVHGYCCQEVKNEIQTNCTEYTFNIGGTVRL